MIEIYRGEGIIRRAGMVSNQVTIELKTSIAPILDYQSYGVPPEAQREYLTVALIALTSNRRVYCTISQNQTPPAPGPNPPPPSPAPHFLSTLGLVN